MEPLASVDRVVHMPVMAVVMVVLVHLLAAPMAEVAVVPEGILAMVVQLLLMLVSLEVMASVVAEEAAAAGPMALLAKTQRMEAVALAAVWAY